MKAALLIAVLGLPAAGCERPAEQTSTPDRAAIRLKGPSMAPVRPSGLPLYDEAKAVTSEREWRETQCAMSGEQDWSELPADRRDLMRLTSAAARGDEAEVSRLLARGVDPGASTPFHMGPLAEAAKCDRAAVLRQLLKAGAPVDRRYEWSVSNLVYRQTPLMIAAQHGSEAAVQVLLAAGANPNLEQLGRRVDERRFYPSGPTLILAQTNAIARRLLKAGADPNAGGSTPLMNAAMSRNPELIQMMLDHGADPNLRDSDGLTALDHALRAPSPEAADLLKAAIKRSQAPAAR